MVISIYRYIDIYIYISSANANPPPCLTRAGHNSMLILTSLLNQRRLRIHDVLGRLKQPLVAILVPFGATLGAPGRPGEPLWTLWGGTLGALALFIDFGALRDLLRVESYSVWGLF